VNEKNLEIVAVPGEKSFTTRRVVSARRDLVFDAFTRPELVRRWMGPTCLPMTTCEIDLRVGGKYHMVHTAPDGQTFGFYGEFREIVRPERIVRTYIFDRFPDAPALETLELDAGPNGRTIIRTRTVHLSVEARDGHVQSGMEEGMLEGYHQLEALLAELQGAPGNAAATP
jgi:uncharacterized protein YndB with AHSA1/START domain